MTSSRDGSAYFGEDSGDAAAASELLLQGFSFTKASFDESGATAGCVAIESGVFDFLAAGFVGNMTGSGGSRAKDFAS